MKKHLSQENTLIGIQAIREIMDIFSGPFLTAYFIKTSLNTLTELSIYNIFVYFVLIISTILVCNIVKRIYKIETFRLSIIFNFIYILMIIILKENVLKLLPFLAIVYGIATATYWVPLGLFLINKIKNENRMNYETKNQLVKTILKISIPILLGSMITLSNYYMTAIILLFLSVIQIIFSFGLTPLEKTYKKFNLKKAWNKIKNIKNVKNTLIIEYLHGLCISNSSLSVILTVLVYGVLQTDFYLGIITSLTSILQMIVIYLYNKKGKQNSGRNIILITSIIPIISLIILLIYNCNITIILFNVLSQIATGLLTVIRTVQVYNTANQELITVDEQCEFWAMRETSINFGRVTSYILLLIVSIFFGIIGLNILMIMLTAIIVLLGFHLRKSKDIF